MIDHTAGLGDHLNSATSRIAVWTVWVFVTCRSTVGLSCHHIVEETDGIRWTRRNLVTVLAKDIGHCMRNTLTLCSTHLAPVTVAGVRRVVRAAAAVSGRALAFEANIAKLTVALVAAS